MSLVYSLSANYRVELEYAFVNDETTKEIVILHSHRHEFAHNTLIFTLYAFTMTLYNSRCFSLFSVVHHHSYAYRDVVMNFVCNLRRLGIYDQLVIAAFDEEMYRYGFRMGLPVFIYQVCVPRSVSSTQGTQQSEQATVAL